MASPALTLTDDDISRMAPATLTDADITAHESTPTKPAQSIGERAYQNLPGSLAHLALQTPGVPQSGNAKVPAHLAEFYKSHGINIPPENIGENESPLDSISHTASAAWNSFKSFIEDPKGTAKEAFANDPAGTIALPAQIVRGLYESGLPQAAAKVATKPGVVKAMGTAVGAGLGHATGIPGAGTVGAVVGRDLGGSIADALAARKVPPIWDDIAQGTAGKKYLDLNLEEQAKVQDLAAKMGAKPATPSPPSNPPSQPAATASAPIETSKPWNIRDAHALKSYGVPFDQLAPRQQEIINGLSGMPSSEPPMAPSVPAMPQPIRLVPRTQPAAPIEPSVAPVLPGAPRPITPPPVEIPKRPVSEVPASTSVPTSDPNVVWDPDRGHIDIRTGKPPIKEPDVVVIPREQAQQIVDRLADTDKLYGKYSAKPNSAAQIQRNADALKKAAEKKPKTVSDLMSVNLENLG